VYTSLVWLCADVFFRNLNSTKAACRRVRLCDSLARDCGILHEVRHWRAKLGAVAGIAGGMSTKRLYVREISAAIPTL